MKKFFILFLFIGCGYFVNAQTNPTASDYTVTTLEDNDYVFASGDFQFFDADGDPFTTVRITPLSGGNGTLFYDADGDNVIDGGEPVTANRDVAVGDIPRIKFRPDPDDNGNSYNDFNFRVNDGNDGWSNSWYTMTLNVTAVNDEPSFNPGGNQTVAEDAGAQTVNNWATSISKGPANENGQTLTFHVSNNNNALFSVQPDVDETTGNLTYTPGANQNGTATVTVYLTDDGGTANGGDDESTHYNFTITVNAVNDPPVLAQNNVLTVNEGDINTVISNTLLQVTDIDNTPSEIVYTITILPAHGTLYVSGTPVAVNGTFTQAQIDANAITYSNNGDENNTDSFTFQVSDGNGGTIPATVFNINVNPVNDNPVFTSSPVTTGTEMVLYTYNITATDADGDPLTFSAVSIPAWLNLVDNGNGTATLSGTPPSGAPLNNLITISVSDGTAPAVNQTWNLVITSGVTADAGVDDTTCVNNSYTLNGNQPPAGYTGTWSVIAGAGTFANPTLYNTLVTGLNSGVAPNNSNTFRWTISNSDGSYQVWDDVVIINNTVVASVTDISNVCGTNAVLQADFALNPGETGLWTVEGSPTPVPVIANPNNRTTAVSGLNYNTNQFRWTVSKETCSDYAIMNVDVIEVWATASAPAEICSEPFIVQGNDPAALGGTGVWTVGAGGGTFANANAPTTTVTGSHQDVVNTYIWTVTVNGCSAQASVDVQNNIPTPATITTPNPSTSCNGTYTISATPADATDPNESGYWTTSTAGVVITNANNATTGVTNLQEGANLFTWHIANGTCPESTADVTINYFYPPTVDAGPDDTICVNDYSLAGTPLEADETGVWTFTTGSGNIVNPNSNTTLVTNLQRGINVLQWTVSHDICSSDDLVTIYNMSVDAIISTTDPLISCTDPSPLITANDPATQDIPNPATAANGFWTVQSGGANVDSPSSWNTTVSNLDPGANNFIWTISNGICTDNDTITVINSIPTPAYAGKDTIVCSFTLPNLNGSNYDNTREIGFWRVIAGGATITDPTLANSSVTNLDYNCTPWTPDWYSGVNAVNVFEWVIRRGTCESTDQVRVLNGLPEPPDAGIDTTVCANVVNLDALDEASCTQEHWWEQLPDVGTFYDPETGAVIPDNDRNMPFNTHVEPIQNGMTQFVWHKRNNFTDSQGNPIVCELTDTVEITSLGNFEDVQAGTNDAVCENYYTLNGTDPDTLFSTPPHVYNTTGEWTTIFGNGNFDDATDHNTTVRNMAAYTNIYRWTITNHDLNCVMSDDVYIYSGRPSNADAGPDQEICVDHTVLSANVPARYTDASWTVLTGGAHIVGNSCTSFACDALAQDLTSGLNTFLWTVTNEYTGPYAGYTTSNPLVCTLTDTLNVTYSGIVADAGADIYMCADTAQLSANVPAGSTGIWFGGSGTFVSSGLNTSTLANDIVHGLSTGRNTFTWTLTKGICSNSDNIVVWNLLPPTPNADIDQTVCDDSTSLNANNVTGHWYFEDPAPPNTLWQEGYYSGHWTAWPTGVVTFENNTLTNTYVTGIPQQNEVSFIWHSVHDFTDYVAGITKQCELTDTMTVFNNSVSSEAGSDGFVCGVEGPGASYTLGATQVNPPMSGFWSPVINPGPSTIVAPTLYNTLVTGMQNGDHIYSWNVSATHNGKTCSASDQVVVKVRIPTTSVVALPDDYEICEDNTTLQANIPILGSGTWTEVPVPSGTIANASSNVTNVTGIGLGVRQFVWTIDNDGCTSKDTITVRNNMILSDADDRIGQNAILHGIADNDSAICQDWYVLSATDPNIYNTGAAPFPAGQWTAFPGTVTFDNNTLYNTTVRNLNNVGTKVSNLFWTITKGGCSEISRLDITNNEFTIDADVNTNPNVLETCDGDIILAAEQPGNLGNASGYWTIFSGGGTIQNPTLYNTAVTGIPKPNSVFRWNVTRFGCNASDLVQVDNNQVTSNAGNDFNVCTDTTSLNGGVPALGETGQWFTTFGGGTVAVPSLYNSHVSNMAQGTNRFRWHIVKGNCSADDEVEIINNEPDDFTIEADKEVCGINSTISVNPAPPIGTGLWTMDAGGASTAITTPTAINTAVTDLQPGNNVFVWTVTNALCSKSDTITLTNNMVIAEAGLPQFVCADSTDLLAANPVTNFPYQGTGTWSVITGTGNVNTPTAYNSRVYNLTQGLNTFRWTMTLGGCSDTDDADVTNNSVQANASNQTVCTNSAVFDGNNPGSANGLWTIVGSSGSPVIADNTLNISAVSNLGTGVNTFRWSVSNSAGCRDSIDITIDNGEFFKSAGPDQALCSATATLDGEDPGAGYSGIWSVIAGGATVTNPTLYNSTVTGLTPGDNVFYWTVTDLARGCTSVDSVKIVNNLPTIATIVTPVPSNREVCSNSTAIEGTNPVFGTGVWTVSTAPTGTYFTNSLNYQTTVNNLYPGNNVITWTISNGTCTSQDQITIINNEVTSVAGADQMLCSDNTSLNATDPLVIYPNQGTGVWTNTTGNSAVILNNTLTNTGVVGLPIGTTTFTWTVSKGICSASDDVLITNNSVTAVATNLSECDGDFTLTGNDPSTYTNGSGYWTIVGSGAGTITVPSIYNTTITGVPNGNTTTLRWHISNGICTDSTDITVTNNNFNITAGASQSICGNSTVMNADPAAPGTGFWTVISGSGIFSNSLSETASVSNINQGTNTYRWTVTKNGCTNTDDVDITNNSPSTAQITGPVVTETCDGTITLTANTPVPYYADNRYWTVVSGGGTFLSASDSYTMNVVGMAPGNNIFKWTIERGACPPSEDQITIVNNEVTAVAGRDTAICSDNIFLNATDPGSIYPNQGTGVWTDLSLTGAVIVNSLLPNTQVTNLNNGITTFRWTVTKGTCSANDNVQITNNSITAVATDLSECSGNFTLTGNDPSGITGGSGYWEIIAGTGTLTVPTLYNTTFTGVPNNSVSTLRWHISNGTCADSTDITVTNNNFDLSAGPDVSQCSDTYTFNADNPAPGTGYWTLIGGNGIISNTTQYDAVVTGLAQGNNVFRWTVTKGGCTNYDDITVENTNPDQAIITAPGPANREICSSSVTVQGNIPSFGSGIWSVNSGNGTFANATNYQTLITGIDPGSNIFTWTISNGACTTSADVTIINNMVAAEAGPNQLLCVDTTSLNATSPTAMFPNQGTGSWTYMGVGAAVIENSLSETTRVTNLPNGTNTFRWTVTNGSCSVYDDVVINNRSVNATATDAQTCDGNIILTGNNPAPGETGAWTTYTGSVTFDNSALYNTAAHNLAEGNNTFVWTIDNGDCSDDAIINVSYINPVASAGAVQNLCDDFTFMGANNPAPGTGVWSVITGSGTFANPSNNGTYVSGIGQGANVYRWTVTEAGCVNFDDVTINNNLPTVSAGPDQSTCVDNVTLSGNAPGAGESGVWTQTGGVPAIITNSTLPNSTVTNLSNGASIFTWTVSNALCSAEEQVTITYNEVIADAGADMSTCDGTAALMAVDPSPGTGYWEAIGAGTFSNVSMFNSNVSGLAIGPNTLRWHQTYAGCSDYDDVVVTNNEVFVNAGLDQDLCSDNTILAGNNPGTGTGMWTRSGGAGTVVNPTFYNSPVTGLSKGVNIFTWTVTAGPCSNSDEVIINNNEITDVNAGVDRSVCGTSAALAALAPHAGESGVWSVAGGTATFVNASQYNTVVNGLVQGDNRLVWTLSNGTCSASDTVVITNLSPTVALVSPDAEICSSVYTLVGNLPGPGETGLWTKEFGATATIADPTANITTAYNIGAGSNTFRWTISNSDCSTYDDIVIDNNTITTDAGLDASLCTDTAVLSADNPAPGTGIWSVVNSAGTPVFDNASMYNTVVRNLASGANIFKWTATKGGCSAWDIVTISNDTPTPANAGSDQTVCDGTVVLSGNNPSVGTGVWSRLGGAGTIVNPSNYNTLVTGLGSGGNTFRWTVTEGLCSDYDDVLIMNELVFASAGMDDEICGTDYPTLNGNQPGTGETGMWTVTGGSGIFANPTVYNTSVSGLSGGENRFTWTVTRGSCSNSDDVSIFNNTPSPATVSSDQEICSDSAVISGNPPTTGTGVWSVAAGSGIFDNSVSNTTTVRNIGPDINQFKWTIRNGTCTSSAIVTITNNSVNAIVGDSIFVCGTTAYLNGNEPQAGENGIWTVTAGTGIIANTALYNTQVTNLNKGENKFRWTISNGTCSDYADLVVTNNLYDATASVAGPTVICVDSADLLGNIPIQGSTGAWSIWAGGGSFDDPTSPTARVKGLLRGDNTLRWTITKDGCSNYDDVVITNNMVQALAGADIITCGNDANLVANELYPGESGVWSLVSGSGTILTPSNNETVVTGQGPGVNVFRWTVTGNSCSDQDEVQVSENSFVTSAGFNRDVCDTTVTLQAQDPSPGTGIWSFSGPGVVIVTPTSNTTVVNGLQDNSPHTFRWTVFKDGCSAWDEVVITNNLVHAHAGGDQFVCHSQATLSAENPIAGTGVWTITAGAGTIADNTYYGTTVTGLVKGTNTLTWTVTNLTCTDADNVVITNNVVQATAGADQSVCQNTTNLSGDQPQNGGYGIWTTAGGPGIVQNPTAFNSTVTNLQRGINTFRWTVYENGCDNGGDLVQIINNDFDAYAGEDQILPPLTTSTYFNADLPANATGQWTVLSGSGNIANLTSPTSFVDNMPTGVNQFTWTVTKTNGCSDSDNVAFTVANFEPYAGDDQIVCSDTAKLNARSELGASSQTWSIVSGGGVFDDIHDPKTIVRHINPGSNVYRWTVSFVGYSASDDVIITNDSIFVDAGDDAVLCERSHQMNAQDLQGAVTERWTVVGIGGGTIVNNSLYNTVVNDLEPGTNYFEWFVDNGHCTSRDTVAITYNLPPIARFETDPTTFCAPDTVVINNTSDYHPGLTEPDEFRWRVEDNYIGTTYNVNDDVTHYFTNTGTQDSVFTIYLVAIDYETQCTDTFTSQVTAYAQPHVEFRIGGSHERRIPNATFNFENYSDTTLNSYYWDFGWAGHNRYDTGFIATFNFTYEEAGTYVITLTGTSGGQCDGIYRDTVVVLPPCPFSYDNGSKIAEGCQDLLVEFDDKVYYADSVLWQFYDIDDPNYSDTSTRESNPVFIYTEPGEYHPKIKAWNDACGSADNPYYTRTDTVIVYPRPVVDFDVAPRLVMLPDQLLSCYNYSDYGSRYVWDFGDGTTLSTNPEIADENPQHLYTEPGVYDITLNVWSEHDCFDKKTIKDALIVKEEGSIEFPTAFTPNPNGPNGGVYPCGEKYIVDKDNLNDVFYPKASGIETYQLEIYNRWGEKIFTSNDICIGWDGYVDGVLAPQDVYVWRVSVTYKNGHPDKKYGSVTLLR